MSDLRLAHPREVLYSSMCVLKPKTPQPPATHSTSLPLILTMPFQSTWLQGAVTQISKRGAYVPNSNYNVKFHVFKEAPTAIVMRSVAVDCIALNC